ncbi:MAG: AcrR family transcriptional regulator [Motiliproteus sp.]|jgi:AcrR family transcriptional regulator
MSASRCTASVGRPRAFDPEVALEQALEVFWRKGYDGTSLADLTEAMGINKPSLYSTFGNKDQLFLKAIERYENRPCAFFQPALDEPTALLVVEKMLYGAAASFSDKSHPQGCIIIQGALSCSKTADAVKEALMTIRQKSEQRLRERLTRAQAEGDIPATTNVETLARYLGTVIQGMSIQANNGATQDELTEVADLVLTAMPLLAAT